MSDAKDEAVAKQIAGEFVKVAFAVELFVNTKDKAIAVRDEYAIIIAAALRQARIEELEWALDNTGMSVIEDRLAALREEKKS